MANEQRDRYAHFGPFIFDSAAPSITKDGNALQFERRHYVILQCLLNKPQEIVRCTDDGFADLLSHWATVEDKHRFFTRYVSEMRNLIGRTDFEECIENIPKPRDLVGRLGGYKFIGTVSYPVQSEAAKNGQVSTEEVSALTAMFGGRDLSKFTILTRHELDYVVGTVENRLKQAEEEIWISGNDNMFVAKTLSSSVVRALKNGRSIRLLGVDPDSPAASMLSIIDPRFEGGTFKREVDFVTEVARDWHREYPKFEYRLLPILPAIGYFITDPKLSSRSVKIELYTAKPWDPLDSRPHLVVDESMPKWREYFIQQFQNYWDLSKAPW